MLKIQILAGLALLSGFATPAPLAAQRAPASVNMVQACRVMHQEEASVSVSDCIFFLQSSGASPETGWVSPFCRALAFYEPELFYSLYANIADCVVHNEEG